jgi:FG-GAP-like repeat
MRMNAFCSFVRFFRQILVGFVLLCLAENGLSATTATLRPNFPVVLPNSGPVRFSTPVAADLDNDGTKWIIVGTAGTGTGGWLYVIKRDGTIRPGWPKQLPAEIASSPAVGDITGDGFPDIVVGFGSNTDLSLPGGVIAFDRSGNQLWRFNPADTDGNGQPDHVWSTPALGDIDGDGILDVVFGSWDFNVYALKGTTGLPLPGWPVFVYDSVWSSPALADLDGDGKLEVIVGADCNTQGPPINIQAGGALWVFRSNGSQYPGFPKFIVQPNGVAPVGIQSSPAVGDITGDGCPKIVVGLAQTGLSTGGQQVYAWKNDGTLLPGWPITLTGQSNGSPALADLEGNGVLDVIMTDSLGWVYGFKGNGTQVFPKVNPKAYTGAPAVVVGGAIAAQVGANNPAILLGGVGWDVTILAKNGTQISDDGTGGGKLTYTTGNSVAGPIVADLDGNKQLTIIAASQPVCFSNCGPDGAVFAWNIGAINQNAVPWPMFHKDEKRGAWASSATPPSTPPSCKPTPPASKYFPVTPCRVSDSRNSGNLTYGGPALAFNEERTITITNNAFNPCTSIPSTAKAVTLNVTVALSTTAGLLRLYPAGDGVPSGSILSYGAGQVRANNATIPLSFDGRGSITVRVEQPSGAVHVIVDVSGYYQ